MSEPIGLGISFHRERLRFALEGAGLTMSCPWPVISRLAELRKELGHPSGRLILAAKAVLIGRPGAVLEGDLGWGERGSIDQAVVLNDRFGCRSRHAARGPRDPGRIARAIEEDLALSCESIERVNERRKPDRGGKAAGSVAGDACECGRRTCR